MLLSFRLLIAGLLFIGLGMLINVPMLIILGVLLIVLQAIWSLIKLYHK